MIGTLRGRGARGKGGLVGVSGADASYEGGGSPGAGSKVFSDMMKSQW